MRLSIIVPVFKVEEFIVECIESLVNQDLAKEDYEIIFINDGSPDNSKEFILNSQSLNSNIIYIEQENQGVSIARNKGLAIAKGNYITFVDSDDFITENSLNNILDTAEKLDLDLLYLSLDLVDEKGNFIEHTPKIGDDGIVKDGFTHKRRTYPPTLYKRKCIGTIVFDPNISIGEDSVFNALVQSNANRCSYCSISYYNYRIRKDSATKMGKNDKMFSMYLYKISVIIKYRNSNFQKLTKQQEQYFNEVLLIFIDRTIYWFIIPNNKKYYFDTLKKYLKNNNLNNLIDEISIKYRFFNYSFLQFYLYNLLKGVYNNQFTLASKYYRKLIKK